MMTFFCQLDSAVIVEEFAQKLNSNHLIVDCYLHQLEKVPHLGKRVLHVFTDTNYNTKTDTYIPLYHCQCIKLLIMKNK